MKRFLAIYVGRDASARHAAWNALTEAERNVRIKQGRRRSIVRP